MLRFLKNSKSISFDVQATDWQCLSRKQKYSLVAYILGIRRLWREAPFVMVEDREGQRLYAFLFIFLVPRFRFDFCINLIKMSSGGQIGGAWCNKFS